MDKNGMVKTRVIFIEPGAKVHSDYYCQHVLGNGLLPDIRTRCQRYTWTLQQDGAPSHTAKNTLAYLRREGVKFMSMSMSIKYLYSANNRRSNLRRWRVGD